MSRRHPLVLERLRNVDGEMLRGRDFRDRIAYDLELHWWHQRAVHQAFGVASGLAVADPQGGKLTVAPGVAYDASGRDLVLLDQATVDLPTSGPPVALVLRPCGKAPRAKLVWKAPARVDPCDGVALALFDLSSSGSVQRLAAAARSLASPRIGTGETSPVATPWELWQPVADGPAGIQTRVGTRAAGFTDLPRYFAWLQWPQLGVNPVDQTAYYALGLQYVQDEAVDSFTFRVLAELPPGVFPGLSATPPAGDPLGFARAQQLYVCWAGVQCDAREQAIEELTVVIGPGSGSGSVTGDVGNIDVQPGDPPYVVWLPRGSSVTLTAHPPAGAHGWSVDGSSSLITTLTLTISMTHSRSVSAFFGGTID